MDTAIVRPILNELKLHAEVIYLNQETQIMPVDCFTLIKNTCEYCEKPFGKAIKESNDLIGPFHKVPIIIDTVGGLPLVLFPLQSPRSVINTWVALHAIDMHRKSTKDPSLTDIHLVNGTVVTVSASFATFNRQFVLANALRSTFMKKQQARQQYLLSSAEPLNK